MTKESESELVAEPCLRFALLLSTVAVGDDGYTGDDESVDVDEFDCWLSAFSLRSSKFSFAL